jgi:transcriptional regulator with XRE-family HTH domain
MKATSSSPCARTLAVSLREEREARGVGLRALADALGLSPQILSQWEIGKRLPGIEDVSAILGYLQVKGEKRERIRELARHAREPNWLAPSSPDVPHALTGVLELEKSAIKMTSWSPTIIPGLLQTPDYIRLIMDNSQMTAEQADTRLGIRLGRQKILTRKDPIRLHAIISEWALRDGIGDEDAMSDQVDHLLEMSGHQNVSLRIIPTGTGYHAGFLGPFDTYEFDDTPSIVFIEHYRSSAFLYDDMHTAAYRKLAKILTGYALSEDASRALLREAAR